MAGKEDMPPPLEDMSAILEKACKLREARVMSERHSSGSANNTRSKRNSEESPMADSELKCSETLLKSKKSASAKSSNTVATSKEFGGMKKGFLSGGTKSQGNSVSNSQKTNTDIRATNSCSSKLKSVTAETDNDSPTYSIPFIKPKKQEQDSSLKLEEVQRAMESTKGFLQDKSWLTDDLLEKIQKNAVVNNHLDDIHFMQALTEFQQNPRAAIAKYQNNSEMQYFLKEFCGILGEHFSSLSDKQNEVTPQGKQFTTQTDARITELSPPSYQAPRTDVDPHVEQILSDPVNREILMDPKIQHLIENLRNNPNSAQKMLHEEDSSFRQKVDKLISLGLLQFQT